MPTLNLLQSDQSSLLTTDQWTLLSNLINCYKESPILPFTQRLIDTHNVSQFPSVFYTELVEDFFVSVYEAAATYLRSNDDIRKLSTDDRSIILHNAADNVCCMGGAFIMHYCHLYDLDVFYHAMNVKYGKRTMDIHESARKFIDPDIVLVKLGISLFAFSENTCSYYTNVSDHLTDPIKIIEIQNKYADLTWKYLLYKYGPYYAVKRFLNLTHWLISIHVLASHSQTLKTHLDDINSIIEQTELKLLLDDFDESIERN